MHCRYKIILSFERKLLKVGHRDTISEFVAISCVVKMQEATQCAASCLDIASYFSSLKISVPLSVRTRSR